VTFSPSILKIPKKLSESFPGHRGRPGEVGGSLPRDEAGGGESNKDISVGQGGIEDTIAKDDKPYDRPEPIEVDTVDEAVSLILGGNVVELKEVEEVPVLLQKLAKITELAKSLGHKAPIYDLCQVYVKGTNLFCASKLVTKRFPTGIPRILMPQFIGQANPNTPAASFPATGKPGEVNGADNFVKYALSRGVSSKAGLVPADKLKVSQRDLVGEKVAGMMLNRKYDPSSEPLFISADNYIIDGHHRWAAAVARDPEDPFLGDTVMKTIRLDAPISEIYFLAKRQVEARLIYTESIPSLMQIHNTMLHTRSIIS
jgi:hypothetical protein